MRVPITDTRFRPSFLLSAAEQSVPSGTSRFDGLQVFITGAQDQMRDFIPLLAWVLSRLFLAKAAHPASLGLPDQKSGSILQ